MDIDNGNAITVYKVWDKDLGVIAFTLHPIDRPEIEAVCDDGQLYALPDGWLLDHNLYGSPMLRAVDRSSGQLPVNYHDQPAVITDDGRYITLRPVE